MKRALFIKLRSLGDTVLLSNSLQAFKKKYPNCKIDIVVDRRWESLFFTDPWVHTIYGVEPKASLWGKLKKIFAIRRHGYDAVFCFHASSTTSWIAALSGAPIRIIHHHEIGRTDRFSTAAIPDLHRVKSVLERDLDTLRAAGLEIGPASEFSPRITLDSPERQGAREMLLNFGCPPPFLAIGLGASRPTKVWGDYSDVARWWAETYRGTVLLVGSASEREAITKIEQTLPAGQSIPVVGWPLRELAAILSECKLFVGNDSGPRHLAAAVGVRTITVFGPEDPHEWHPYFLSQHPILHIPNLACRVSPGPERPPWCGLETCTKEGHRCMKEITPHEVQAALQKLMV